MHAAHISCCRGRAAGARALPADRPIADRGARCPAGRGPGAGAAGANGRLGGLLITCDQVVVCGGRVLEKPTSPAQARRIGLGRGAPARPRAVRRAPTAPGGRRLQRLHGWIGGPCVPACARAALPCGLR